MFNYHSPIPWGSFRGRQEEKWGSFRGRDHFGGCTVLVAQWIERPPGVQKAMGSNPIGAQAPVVQRLDNAIHRINLYPVDKCSQNKPRYPLDCDLSGG